MKSLLNSLAGQATSSAIPPSITDLRLRNRLSYLAFVVASFSLAGLVLWATFSAWAELAILRASFGVAQSDRFHLAGRVQNLVTLLEEARHQRRADPSQREEDKLVPPQGDLLLQIDAAIAAVNAPQQVSLLNDLRATLVRYFPQSALPLSKPPANTTAAQALMREEPEEAVARIRTLAEDLRRSEQESWRRFMGQSADAVIRLQGFLAGSVILITVLGFIAARLLYLTRIAPLRSSLAQTRSALERQEKLAALGTLAAGVAHEIRNPLTAINVRLHGLKRVLSQNSSGYDDVEVIHEETRRLERIVQDFLQFARPSPPCFQQVDVAALFEQVKALLRPLLEGCAIAVCVDVSHRLFVRADPQQFEQVLVNLVQNAAESIQRNGTITLRAAEREVRVDGGEAGIAIEVTDTGKGIEPEVESRLFDPFYSTKEGGLGLGLSIAARIVERHGGSMEYQSKVGQGATFVVILPQAGGEIHRLNGSEPDTTRPGGASPLSERPKS